ncbi:uncharacterized protein LOC144927222 [Branchiostoma floridae x Branchiostoma belcheri]
MPVARKIIGRGTGRVKSVPGAGRGRGAVGRGSKKPTRGKRVPSPIYSEAGFSLYSTDSEDQVTSTNKGLDRCAALLGDILSREPPDRSTTQGLKHKPTQQPKAKTKPNPAKTKVPQSKTKTTKPVVKKTTAPQQTTARRSPEKVKQGNLSPYAFRVPTVPVQGAVLQQQVPPAAQRTLFNERIPSSTPNLSPDPKRPPSPNTLLQMLRAQNRAPVQNVPHSPPQKDGGQYQQGKDFDATSFPHEYTTANDQRGGREQLDSVPVRDRENVSPARRSLFQSGGPVVDRTQGNESKTDQEQDDLDETLTSSPKRPPSRASEKEAPRTSPGKSLQTLRYLLRELQAAADDPEVKRLAQEVERIVGQLPETRRAADMQTDIDLALQPLRSENSQLRRRVRILNQQLREKERAERENRAPDFSFEDILSPYLA